MSKMLKLSSWKKVLRRVSPVFRIAKGLASGETHVSFSQYAEDLLLLSYLSDRIDDPIYKGFWVDVGAHHPRRFSNTALFSFFGWRGINVDAMPNAIDLFNKMRPRDINVNVGVGKQAGRLEYFKFNDYAVNTFVPELAEKAKTQGFLFQGSSFVPVITLRDLLDEYLPVGQHIDFLSVDAEGFDFQILESNDWTRYRPDYVLVELHTFGHNERIFSCEACRFLRNQGYEFAAQTLCTTLFKRVR